ncbi:MAG TPA: TatD family hydrolase [Nitrososphaeraceae archaeon]
MNLAFDAHIHLTDHEYSGYLQYLLCTLRSLRINACSVTVNIETCLRSLSIFNSDTKDIVTQFIGIHPEFANEDIEEFEKLLNRNELMVDGIGEVGLDPSYQSKNHVSYDQQKSVFNSMLSYAEKYDKPVSIHSRNSVNEILDIINTYRLNGVLLHWFSGTPEQLKRAMDLGLYVSYGPSLVYSKFMKESFLKADLERILVETDGPVRYYKCFDNLISISSSFLISVINSASYLLKVPFPLLAEQLRTNSKRFLGRSI